jgi:8-oxo-dGTP pyrophosphatase MutT (NUDIX family)
MHQGNILVHESENRNIGEIWFVPPGGGVEYGESSLDALKREIMEELGWNIKDEKLIGSFESFHVINDIEEHEISFVYFAKPVNESVFDSREFLISEDNGMKKVFTWKRFADLASPGSLLYPKGLFKKIKANEK